MTHSDIIYHQYGYYFHQNFAPLIEDAIDSFFSFGVHPLRTNALFAVWSFRKSHGLSNGAVLWCKRETDVGFIKRYQAAQIDSMPSEAVFSVGQLLDHWPLHWQSRKALLLQLTRTLKGVLDEASEAEILKLLDDGILPLGVWLDPEKAFQRYTHSKEVVVERFRIVSNLVPTTKKLFLPLHPFFD